MGTPSPEASSSRITSEAEKRRRKPVAGRTLTPPTTPTGTILTKGPTPVRTHSRPTDVDQLRHLAASATATAPAAATAAPTGSNNPPCPRTIPATPPAAAARPPAHPATRHPGFRGHDSQWSGTSSRSDSLALRILTGMISPAPVYLPLYLACMDGSVEMPRAVETAAQALAGATALLVTAGAGMGVDSGLPDFRGDEGFWKAYPPMAKLGISFVEMANPTWFRRDPELAWGFYGHRLNLYRATRPHRGFEILLRWGSGLRHGLFVFTSNVDGQFQRAGFPEERIVECHGSIHHLQCAAGCSPAIWSAEGVEVRVDETTFRARPPLPACHSCEGLARPNVLMFGDWQWIPRRTGEQEARFEAWLRETAGPGLVVVELGAGTAVPTVRMTSERVARSAGGTLVRINPREPHGPPGTVSVAAGALEALAAIDERLTRG